MNTENSPQPQETPSPLLHNAISLIGLWLALAFFTGEIIIIVVDLLYGAENPYVGILIYIVGPSIMLFGLSLVPIGMWIEQRRRKKDQSPHHLPRIDFNLPRHRAFMSIFVIVAVIFLMMTSLGSYQAYHITESNAFCGLVCHQVMKPEYTAYHVSPHARVDCVKCHIGPGATWFVKSKLSGAAQVWAVLTDSYELPIDTPIENLRPARDTCEQCHWPEQFYASVEKSFTHYARDEDNTPYVVDMLLNVGGSSESLNQFTGIHWHIALDHTLEYYATDEDRQNIPWIRVTYDDGRVIEYIDQTADDFDPAEIPEEEIRTFDCIDCHNRPSHRYRSPDNAVDQALAVNLIDPQIPDVKSVVAGALEEDYESTEAALEQIEAAIRDKYQGDSADPPLEAEQVDSVVEQALRIYQENVFPEQEVDWTTHDWNLGHFQFKGCYRCHGGDHQTESGQTITNECRTCHVIVRQGEGWETVQNLEYQEQTFEHPRGLGDLWQGDNCHVCHGA